MAKMSWRPLTGRSHAEAWRLTQQSRTLPDSHDFHVQRGTGAPAVSCGAEGVRASISKVRQVPARVLLARPGYAGTIAAIRDLARDQIPVAVLAESLLECGRWSKYVSATIRTGPQADPKSLLAALEKLTEDGTGPVAPVLLPTCDTSAWTYAAYADRLSPHFCLYAPPLETVDKILDKGLFETACADADVPVLKSWKVRNEAVLAEIADTLLFPLIIKPPPCPRRRNDKGEVVANHDQLAGALGRIERSDTFYDADGDSANTQDFFLQQFVEVFPKGVLSVTGFIDRSGTHFVARSPARYCCDPNRRGWVCVSNRLRSTPRLPSRRRACVAAWAFSVCLRSSTSGMAAAGQRSTSTRASSTRWRWTSREGCPWRGFAIMTRSATCAALRPLSNRHTRPRLNTSSVCVMASQCT